MKGKKARGIVAALMILVLCVSMQASVFAVWYEDNNLGISFSLNQNWISDSWGNTLNFYHKDSGSSLEEFEIEASEDEGYLPIEEQQDQNLVQLLDQAYSDSKLSKQMSDNNNGVYVTCTQDYRDYYRESHNGQEYFRYEKVVTYHARDYYDLQVYYISYTTVKNGRFYEFLYSRPSDQNHYNDFIGVLDSVEFAEEEIKIMINGERIYPDSAPLLVNDRTLVPIRAVAEAMGYSVEWIEESQRVIMTSMDGKTQLSFGIGDSYALKNLSERISLDVPANIYGERTYLPLRAVAESMDAFVDWDDATQTVLIEY